MQNLWPDFSEIKKIQTPKELLDEQAALLPKLTGDMVYAYIVKLSAGFRRPGKKSDFGIVFYIKGKFLENYSFRVFTIYHDIGIYPAEMELDSEIKEQIHRTNDGEILINDENELTALLKEILGSDKIKNVVASIVSLSK